MRAIANKKGIEGYKTMSKEELLDAFSSYAKLNEVNDETLKAYAKRLDVVDCDKMSAGELAQAISDINERYKVIEEITKEFTIKFQDHTLTINQKFKIFQDTVNKSHTCFIPVDKHPLLKFLKSHPKSVVRNIDNLPFFWK